MAEARGSDLALRQRVSFRHSPLGGPRLGLRSYGAVAISRHPWDVLLGIELGVDKARVGILGVSGLGARWNRVRTS